MNDSLGARMKQNYELPFRTILPWRMPVIVRLDGRCFHTFTRQVGAVRPFDDTFIDNMADLALYLCKGVATMQFAYVQSDEISLLLHPYKRLTSQPWFGNEVQKIVSVSAGLASQWFSRAYNAEAVFDSRVFVLPEAEVCNYFVWRQQDAVRNSIAMLAQAHFSPQQLHGKDVREQQSMLLEKGVEYGHLPTCQQRGFCVVRGAGGRGMADDDWAIEWQPPLFKEDRQYVERWLATEDETE